MPSAFQNLLLINASVQRTLPICHNNLQNLTENHASYFLRISLYLVIIYIFANTILNIFLCISHFSQKNSEVKACNGFILLSVLLFCISGHLRNTGMTALGAGPKMCLKRLQTATSQNINNQGCFAQFHWFCFSLL